MLCLDFSSIYCIHDTFVPDVHPNIRSVLKDGADIVANLTVLGVQVLGRRDGGPGRLELVSVKEITG